jgi:hypothetical protein
MTTKPKADLKDILSEKVNNLTEITSAAGDGRSENLTLYNQVRIVPSEAQKTITGGRLNGFTDINPMWRIKTLTEQFGVAGFGWYYDIKRMWTEPGANDEIAVFAEIDLYIKQNGEWSKPIKGIGGSSFVSKDKNGLYTSDEAYKMALTDAISTSCKALGFAADIYYSKDRTKYDNKGGSNTDPNTTPTEDSTPNTSPTVILTEKQINRLHAIRKSVNVNEVMLQKLLIKHCNKESPEELSKDEYDFICTQLEAMKQKNPA